MSGCPSRRAGARATLDPEDEPGSNRLRLSFTDSAAVEVPVDGLEAFRLRVAPATVPSAAALTSLQVEVRTRTSRVGRWTWTPRPGSLHAHQPRRVAFRPGEHSAEVSSTDFTDPHAATRVVLAFRGTPGVRVDLHLEVAALA